MNSIITSLNQMNDAVEAQIARFLGVKQIRVSWAMFFICYGSIAAAVYMLY